MSVARFSVGDLHAQGYDWVALAPAIVEEVARLREAGRWAGGESCVLNDNYDIGRERGVKNDCSECAIQARGGAYLNDGNGDHSRGLS
jgi:hypothetical protein